MDIFNTDWAAMTFNDWIGTLVTVSIFFLMIWAYIYALHPKNKKMFESQSRIPMDDEDEEETKQ